MVPGSPTAGGIVGPPDLSTTAPPGTDLHHAPNRGWMKHRDGLVSGRDSPTWDIRVGLQWPPGCLNFACM
ncbi:unnamed protein product, partial [Protopolystoma xenopodis]